MPGFARVSPVNGADLPRADGLCQRIFCAGVKPQLVGLFGPGLAVRFAGELGLDLQFPARDPQPRQPLAPLILRDFEHPRTESFQRRGGAGVFVEAGHQLVHTLQSAGILPLQGHAKPAGKDVPPGDGRDDVLRRQAVVNAGLTLNFTDEKEKDPATGKPWKESWCYEHGIADYVAETAGEDSLTPVFSCESEATGRDREDQPDYKVKMSAAFCFSNKVEMLEYYHNCLLYTSPSPRD